MSKVAQQRLSVLELARELGNVAEACRLPADCQPDRLDPATADTAPQASPCAAWPGAVSATPPCQAPPGRADAAQALALSFNSASRRSICPMPSFFQLAAGGVVPSG